MITEVKDKNSVTLGLGTLGLYTLPAGSPVAPIDVGYIKACTVTYSRELKDFESAGLLVKRLTFRDRLNLTADWAELSIKNLSKIIPSTVNGSQNGMTFGGDRSITRYGVQFEHTRDDNKVVTVRIYSAIASGDFALAFAEEDYIKFPVAYSAEADSTKAVGQQYGSITIA